MVYINGKWRQSETKMEVRNPATNEVIKTVFTVGKAETEEAIQSAQQAFKSWKKQLLQNALLIWRKLLDY